MYGCLLAWINRLGFENFANVAAGLSVLYICLEAMLGYLTFLSFPLLYVRMPSSSRLRYFILVGDSPVRGLAAPPAPRSTKPPGVLLS